MNESKKRIGRPRLEGSVASNVVHVRLTPERKGRWAAAAAAAGLPMGGWVRKAGDSAITMNTLKG